jgi:uncharacterized cupin superfamily protein
MKKPLINAADAPTHSDTSGEHFAYSMTELAAQLDAQAIGANITRVPPGKAAFPFHHHHANEEHFFVLSGSGVLRWGSKTYPVKRHDYIVNVPGGPEHGHQLINTGAEDLVYLAISTRVLPEVVGYPDSNKTGVRTAWTRDKSARFLVAGADKDSVSYWEGEDGRHVAAIVAASQRNGPR